MAMLAACNAALYAVANRRSAESAAIPASAKSRAMSARIASSSFFDALCLWTSRFTNNCVQVTLAPTNELFMPFQHGGKEMILGLGLGAELARRVVGDAHLPPQTSFSLAEGRRQLSQTHRPDHH